MTAQANISQMEKVIAYQIKIQMLHVQVDFLLMEKEIVYGFLYQHILRKIHPFLLLNKYLFHHLPQSHKLHTVHQTFSQMVLEIVLNNLSQ